MKPKPPQFNKQQGTVLTEFIFIIPLFLLLVFFILEISQMWIDKHFLRLGGFEAARVLATTTFDNPCEDDATVTAAKRVLGLRMAAVAPSTAKILREAGLGIEWNGFKSAGGTAAGQASLHLMERLPAALALTQLKCRFDVKTQQIRAEVSYFRTAKMPFIKHVFWGLYVIQKFGRNAFKMDSRYFNVVVKNPAQQGVDDLRKFLVGWKGSLAKASAAIAASGWHHGDALAARWFDVMERGIDDAERKTNKDLEDASRVINAVVYAVPDSLRLMPVSLTVNLNRSYFERKGEGWTDGQAIGVAPFTSAGKDSPWTKWVKRFQHLKPSW